MNAVPVKLWFSTRYVYILRDARLHPCELYLSRI